MATPLVKGSTLSYTKEKNGKPDGAKFGKRTGLTMTAYCNEMFVANAKQGNQRGDGELMAELLAEFPKRGSKGSNTAVQAVSAYRGYFNTSKHGFNPEGKGTNGRGAKAECYRRNIGENAPKPVHNAEHPNTGRTFAKGKAAKGKAAKGKAAKGKAAKGKAGSKPAKKAPRKRAAKPVAVAAS